MSKITGLSFGRKNGNCEAFLKAALMAAEEEGVESEIIRAMDMKILPCKSCGACFSNPTCQERFGTAVRADQKNRRLCCQGCKDGGIQVFQPLDAQFRCEGLSHGACLLFELPDRHQEGHYDL